MTRATDPYFDAVAKYYDAFAPIAAERYCSNPVLTRMRADFRRWVDMHDYQSALDLGCGAGLDLVELAARHPGRAFYGLDVSPEMVRESRKAVEGAALSNVHVACAPLGGFFEAFPKTRVDLVWSFFGVMNTCPSLGEAVTVLENCVTPGGTLVLSFINRVYPVDSLIHLLRARPGKALARVLDRWTGYTDQGNLSPRLYTPHQITRAFERSFDLVHASGYCIAAPAWYRAERWEPVLGPLWKLDSLLNRSPLRGLGEHTLFVFRQRA